MLINLLRIWWENDKTQSNINFKYIESLAEDYFNISKVKNIQKDFKEKVA